MRTYVVKVTVAGRDFPQNHFFRRRKKAYEFYRNTDYAELPEPVLVPKGELVDYEDQ